MSIAGPMDDEHGIDGGDRWRRGNPERRKIHPERAVDSAERQENRAVMRRIARNSGWLFSAKGLGAILSIVYLAILTRLLGPAGFGLFILIVSAVQMGGALLRPQGWQTVVQYGVARARAGEDDKFARLAWLVVGVELAGGLVATLVAAIALPVAAFAFGWPREVTVGALVYAACALLVPRTAPLGVLRAHDRFRDGAFADAVIPIVRMAGAGAVLAIDGGIGAFLIAWGASEVAGSAAMWWYVARRVPLAERASIAGARVGWRENPGLFGFLFNSNAATLIKMLRERGAVIVVGAAASAGAAGLFRLADQLANSVNRLTEIFARPLFAELSLMRSGEDTVATRRLFIRALLVSSVAGAAMFALLVLLGRWLIALIAGDAFYDTYDMLLVLGAATIVQLVGVGFEPSLQAAGRAGLASALQVAGLVALAALLALLVPTMGGMGAAWALLASAVLVTVATGAACWKAVFAAS